MSSTPEKPYSVDCLDHDSWSIVRDRKIVLCSIPTKTHADQICSALNSAYAAGRASALPPDGHARKIGEKFVADYAEMFGVGGRMVPATSPHGIGLCRESVIDVIEYIYTTIAHSARAGKEGE